MSAQPEALRMADALEISSNHGMRREAAAELRRLVAQRDVLLKALTLIANTNPVDAALDPQRAVRVANAAIKQAEENT